MPFNSWQEAEQRLANDAPLTSEEIRQLLPWMNLIGEVAIRRLNAHLALENIDAARKFEKSTTSLTKWLVWLTVALVFFGLVTAVYTIVLAYKEPSVQRQVQAQTPAKKTLGPWKAKFTIPGAASLPDDNPTVKCSFSKSPDSAFGFIGVTVANLSDNSYAARFNIYGYDQNGRRISQGSDEFAIGRRETVLRDVFLKSEESTPGKLGSVFWIQLVLED